MSKTKTSYCSSLSRVNRRINAGVTEVLKEIVHSLVIFISEILTVKINVYVQ